MPADVVKSGDKVDLCWLTGYSPMLTDFDNELRFYPVCPVCGAVRFGNALCDECKSYWVTYGKITPTHICVNCSNLIIAPTNDNCTCGGIFVKVQR